MKFKLQKLRLYDNMELNFNCRVCPGFTLTEMLVAVSLVAMLFSLLVPALGKARDKARQIVCMSNLRQVSLGILNYAQDNEGWAPPAWDGTTFWEARLVQCKYFAMPSMGKSSVFVCPSVYPKTFVALTSTYGIRADPTCFTVHKIIDSQVLELALLSGAARSREEPSSYPLLADSFYVNSQYYTWRNIAPQFADGKIHLRHFGTANVAFADGHVECCNVEKLAGFGVTHYTDENGVAY